MQQLWGWFNQKFFFTFISWWDLHCVKSVQTRSFFWSVFSHNRNEYEMILCISPYSVRMRENTSQKKLRIWTLFTRCYIKQQFLYIKKNYDDVSSKDWDFGRNTYMILYISIKPLSTNVPLHIETSQLICIANQLTGFSMMGDIGL